MPRLNRAGATNATVQQAVREIERAGSPHEYIDEVLAVPPKQSWTVIDRRPRDGILLAGLPSTHRLALEMALHEEQERHALSGELRILEDAWRSAEEVASIADGLLIPDSVRARLGSDQLRSDEPFPLPPERTVDTPPDQQ